MKRRTFLSGLAGLAGSLILPYEPKRVYSFPTPVEDPALYFARIFDQNVRDTIEYIRSRREILLFRDGSKAYLQGPTHNGDEISQGQHQIPHRVFA